MLFYGGPLISILYFSKFTQQMFLDNCYSYLRNKGWMSRRMQYAFVMRTDGIRTKQQFY